MRPSGRKLDEMRNVSIETNITMHAEGSCIIKARVDAHMEVLEAKRSKRETKTQPPTPNEK